MAEKQEVIFIEYTEVEALVAGFLGLPEYDTLVGDLYDNDSRWCNGTTHLFQIGPEEVIEANHVSHLAEVRERGEVKWNWELDAILNELVRQGDIEAGLYLINVCW